MLLSYENALGIHPVMAQLRTTKMAVQSGNIFNAETPGYRARIFNLHLDHPPVTMTTTDKRHILNTSEPESSVSLRNPDGNISADGNDVSLAQEQAELAQTIARINISLSMIRDRISMLDRVITGH